MKGSLVGFGPLGGQLGARLSRAPRAKSVSVDRAQHRHSVVVARPYLAGRGVDRRGSEIAAALQNAPCRARARCVIRTNGPSATAGALTGASAGRSVVGPSPPAGRRRREEFRGVEGVPAAEHAVHGPRQLWARMVSAFALPCFCARRATRRSCRLLGLAPVDRLDVQGVAEDEGNALLGAEVGDPVPGEDAFHRYDDILAVRGDRREQMLGRGRARWTSWRRRPPTSRRQDITCSSSSTATAFHPSGMSCDSPPPLRPRPSRRCRRSARRRVAGRSPLR